MSTQDSPISTSAKPRQKRYHRRSARACDECRLRKCKCDGQSPCGPCRVTGNDCTYDPKPIPVQKPTLKVRELEARLRSVRAAVQDLRLRARRDGINGSEPELRALEDYLGISSPPQSSPSVQEVTPHSEDGDHAQSKSMMGNAGRFVAANVSLSTFYGHMSGFNFICRTLELFQPSIADAESNANAHAIICNVFDAMIPERSNLPTLFGNGSIWPEWHVLTELVDSAFNHCRPLSRLFRLDEFQGIMKMRYDTKTTGGDKESTQLIRLLHAVLAIGALFNRAHHRQRGCNKVVEEATTHFLLATATFDIHEAPNLLRIKTLVCFIIFLVSTSRMGTAHSYLGLACSAATRLGLNVPRKIDVDGKQTSEDSKLFLLLLEYDIYISIILDVPQIINLDDIDPETFLPVVQDARSSLNMTPDALSASTILESELSQAHIQLLLLLSNALKTIFHDHVPSTSSEYGHRLVIIDDKLVKEADADFERWMKRMSPLLTKTKDSPEHKHMRFKLETTFCLSQLLIHLPFLHYLTPSSLNRSVTVTQSQIALSCIKTASDTIMRLSKLYESGSYIATTWSTVYTIFISVVCLMFLIAAHEGTSRPGEAWKRAECGIRLLVSIQCADNGANACLEVIKLLISRLKHTVDFDMVGIESTAQRICGISRYSSSIPPSIHRSSQQQQQQQQQQQYASNSTHLVNTRHDQGPFSIHNLLTHETSDASFPGLQSIPFPSHTHFKPSPHSSGSTKFSTSQTYQNLNASLDPSISSPVGTAYSRTMEMSPPSYPISTSNSIPAVMSNADDILAKAQQSRRVVDFDMFLNFE